MFTSFSGRFSTLEVGPFEEGTLAARSDRIRIEACRKQQHNPRVGSATGTRISDL